MPEVSKTADHALHVLETLGGRGSLSIAEVARELDLSRTVAYRLLSTLEQRGFVRRTDGIYRLGPKLFALAQHVEWALRDAAHPFMVELGDQIKETVVLAVRDGAETLSIHRLACRDHMIQVLYPPGLRHHLTETVAGRAILAYLDDPERQQVIGRRVEDLIADLGRIRRSGYAYSTSDQVPGLAALAVPIRSIDGVVASLTVYMPTERAAAVKLAKESVLATAAAITGQLTGA
jgi:DNA-binding IclR family transcriptional regulator